MHFAVTGGAGFIDGHIVKNLIKKDIMLLLLIILMQDGKNEI